MPYVLYEHYDNSKSATVMKYENSSWEVVGTRDFNSPNTTDNGNPNIIITFDNNDIPYIMYMDYNNSLEYHIGNVTVMNLNNSNFWGIVG